MDLKNHDILQPYRECAGKECSWQGTHYLRIHFINKNGWFCDSCKNSLIDNKLADAVENSCKVLDDTLMTVTEIEVDL